jgi:hypothetical protein
MRRIMNLLSDLLFGAPVELSRNERMRAVLQANPLPEPVRTQEGDPEKQRHGLKVRAAKRKAHVVPMKRKAGER